VTRSKLPTFRGDPDGVAFGINDNGDVVGASVDCATFSPDTLSNLQALHALLWQEGTVTDLGSLGGTGHGMGILACNLNDQDQVVGLSDLPGDTTFHAFLWTKQTGMQDLGTLPGDVTSAASGINERGQVVGLSLDASFNPTAFLRQNGVMTDLNTLIPADSPLVSDSSMFHQFQRGDRRLGRPDKHRRRSRLSGNPQTQRRRQRERGACPTRRER
jgi:probable HAF family extracellular repeat protein